MRYLVTLGVALRGIFAHKLRSFLTVLGVAIGIGSIISMMAVGEGSERSVTEGFTTMGSNLLYIVPGAGYMGLVSGAEGSAATLTYEDVLAIKESPEADTLKRVVPETGTNQQLIAGDKNANAQVVGTTPEYADFATRDLANGEFFAQYDVDNKTMVCVLGSQLARKLFDETDPLGQRVRAKGRSFTVLGVLEPDGASQFSSADNRMIIPITTEMYRINPRYSTRGDHLVSSIMIEAAGSSRIDDAAEYVTELLRERHDLVSGDDDFTIYNQKQILDTQTQTSDTMKTLLKYIAIMALVIAGIGIMNIMLVSVTERTREIGIRKAVGAKQRHILIQFWLEATTIGIIGGIIGIGVGYLLSESVFTGFKVNSMMGMSQGGIDPVVQGQYILWSFLVAIVVGMVSGIYPAWRAARLNPIEALRYE